MSYDDPIPLMPGVVMRVAVESDAESLCSAYRRNRDHLQPWEPRRDDEFFTLDGQLVRLRSQLEQLEAKRMVPWLLLAQDAVIGRVNLSNVVLSAFRSATLGYWIDAEYQGRGLATSAVASACEAAREQLGLHRLEAGTAVDNVRSQRVLAKSGFELIGPAPAYLEIDGAWRDHLLFQKILHDRSPFQG
ncbi:MAG: GNAT family N-acetyltransferase [Actinobacteria bacterium]|nr:GNAT family N-acetyltransferase [Actinomycetota bacterium]